MILNTGYMIKYSSGSTNKMCSRLQDAGYRKQDTDYKIQNTGYRIQDTGNRIHYS